MSVVPYVENPTWVNGSGGGTPIDAADLNKIEQGITDVSLAPCARVYHNANQSIANTTETALAFNSERFDQVGGAASDQHDTATNNSRLTCKYAGVYQITANVRFDVDADGYRGVALRVNGATRIAESFLPTGASASLVTIMSVSTLYALAVNDYVEVLVQHSAGAALNVVATGNVSPEFGWVRVG